jgi:starvation-inducible outer membrane lipoprotein
MEDDVKGRFSRLLAGLTGLFLVTGCGNLPSRYIQQAEPGVTLTSLAASPDTYQGKTVILGGVVVDQQQNGPRLWLHLKNRPLDKDYRPHRPTINEGPEAGYYWVVVQDASLLPPKWKQWARVTVVGRVADQKEARPPAVPASEPVLGVVFMRGWAMGNAQGGGAWEESVDANYLLSVPEGLHGE